MPRSYAAEILFGAGCIALIGLAFVLGRYESARNSYPCSENSPVACSENYYRSYIEKYGSIAALHDLEKRYDRGGVARTYCHPLLHVIGEAAGKEFGSVSKAYEYGDTFCRSGYYHGVLEGIFANDGAGLLNEINSICADVQVKEGYSYNYFSCVHGIGHGLMAYFDHDVFASLEGCDRLANAWEQSSCHGGVFMENVISNTVEMPSRFLKHDDPIYPCNAVDSRYREQCFLMQTSYMLEVANGDFEKVFEQCASVEEGYRTTCYQSLGRDASGYSAGNAEAANAYCALGKIDNMHTECIIGAAVDFIQSKGIAPALSMCDFAPDRDACYEMVHVQASTL